MNNLTKKIFSTLLITVSLTSVVIPATYAQQESQTTNTQSNQKPKKSISILAAILRLLKKPENRRITRGNDLCFISPGKLGQELMWSDRPWLIWQGENSQSTVNLYSSSANFNYEQDEQMIWSQVITANSVSIAYNGKPLQPGFRYDWEFVTNGETYRSSFVMMTEEERQAIAEDLTAIENRTLAEGKDREGIAIAKADYLAQKQLWSDVLQQLYSVENPSPDLVSKTEDIEQYLCESSN